MFKLYEQQDTKTYLVDMADANAANIVPGSILVLGANGVRLAGVTDIPTLETQGQYLVASDYAQNASMTNINGYTGLSVANIAAMPIGEPFELAYDFDGPVAKGDKFVIYNGEIVPVTNEVYAPALAIFEAIETNFTGVEVKLRATGHPAYTQPQLYIISDAGMVEGAQTCSMSIGSGGIFNEAEVEDEATNWVIGNLETFFDVDTPTFTVNYVGEHEIEIEFDAGVGNTIVIQNADNLEFDLLAAAIDGAVADPDTLVYDSYAAAVVNMALSTEDDSAMVEGSQTGTLVLGITGGEFDQVNALISGNWTIDASGITDEVGGQPTFTVDAIAVDGSTATISFDAGGGQTLIPGLVEIAISHEAVVGLVSGDLEYEYHMPQVTFEFHGAYDAVAHNVGEVLTLADGSVEAGRTFYEYDIIDADTSVPNEEVITLASTGAPVLGTSDENGWGMVSWAAHALESDGVCNTVGEPVESYTFNPTTESDVDTVAADDTIVLDWLYGGTDPVFSIGVVTAVSGDPGSVIVEFTLNEIEGNPAIPDGTAVSAIIGVYAEGLYRRTPLNLI